MFTICNKQQQLTSIEHLHDSGNISHCTYRGVVKTPYIMGTLLSLASIVGNILPLPNNDVDSATQKNNNY